MRRDLILSEDEIRRLCDPANYLGLAAPRLNHGMPQTVLGALARVAVTSLLDAFQ